MLRQFVREFIIVYPFKNPVDLRVVLLSFGLYIKKNFFIFSLDKNNRCEKRKETYFLGMPLSVKIIPAFIQSSQPSILFVSRNYFRH